MTSQMNTAQDLSVKNAALERELNSVTEKNQKLHEAYEDLASKVQDIDRLSNLRAWGVDRAVSIYQINRTADKSPSYEEVVQLAEKLALYSYGEEFSRIREVAKKMGETIQ